MSGDAGQPPSAGASAAGAGSKVTGSDLNQALDAWRQNLGSDYVLTQPAILDRYAASSSSRPVRALAVLKPASQAEVAAAVKTAARHRIPLYPISRGRNWGYGDACPVSDENVIVDLERMNRIVTVDSELAYAVIEPGVTQGQLSEHLRSNFPSLWPDCTGAGPDTSIAGNVLDRGFGHTPYGNRAQFISGMEVVLADGRVLRTGFGHFAGARATHLFPSGVGPALDGLFVQSGFGIVTKLGIWLMPAPEAYSLFICSLEANDDIAAFVDDLRPLRLDNTVRSVVHMGNDLRVISGGTAYPRALSPDGGPLPMDLRKAMRKKGGFGAWMIAGGLYGSKRQVAAHRHEVRARLSRPGRKLFFFDQNRLSFLERVSRPFAHFGRVAAFRNKLVSLQSLYDMNRGVPSHRFLAGAYWRHHDGLPAAGASPDPSRDGCGLLWLPPVLPANGGAVKELLRLAEPIFARHGFDFFITLSTVTERSLGAVMTIAYDQTSEAEARAARACGDALCEALIDAGFPPYRVGPAFVRHLARGSETFWDVVGELKHALDPNAIMSPGRYDPRDFR